jgi:heptosyltransferase-2
VSYSKILVRATNWVGDAVMSLPALRAIRQQFPDAHISVLARPWVADLYARESFCNRLIPYTAGRGISDLSGKLRVAGQLRRERFDCAILLQNAFDAALIAWLARIPARIGYDRDGRGMLLTTAVPVPQRNEIPPHERFYYLELLRRAGILSSMPASDAIRLEGAEAAAEAGRQSFHSAGLGDTVVGLSPGAAYGTAKRWLPDRFAEAACTAARELRAAVAVFGSKDERELGSEVAAMVAERGIASHNFAGETSLREFIEMAATCQVFLTNDSGAMHIASAAGVPTVAVFGATDHVGTGPTGPLARVVREPVECSPCLLRECPIDHRCMTAVSSGRVAEVALELARGVRQ